MKKLILTVTLIGFVFSGCATKQMIDESNQDKAKLKKAIVKLIKKNKTLTNQIKEQNIQIEELHKDIDSLNKKTVFLDRQIKTIKTNQKNNTKSTLKQEVKKEKSLVKLWKKDNKKTFFIEVVKHKANLRVLPEPDAQIVGVASMGDEFEVIERSTGENRWYKVLYKDESLWIYSETVRVLGN